MAANYESITSYQRTLTANTVSSAITLPTSRTPATRVAISAPFTTGGASRSAPVCFLFRAGGSTEPTTVAADGNGDSSPCLPPGSAGIEVAQIPTSATQLVLKSREAGEVYVQIYEVAQ